VSLLTYPEAAVIGLLQGVSELFPVSSLGHAVLIPALIGGRWSRDLSVSAPESPYLAFIVGLHVATAAALVLYFRHDWVRLARGLVTSVRHRRLSNSDERLVWLLILATIPVGIAGLALEHTFRTVLSKPVPTAVFLGLNGLILLAGQQLADRRIRQPAPSAPGAPGSAPPAPPRQPVAPQPVALQPFGPQPVGPQTGDERVLGERADRRLARLPVGRAVLIGCAQILALAPGISRSGATMVAGMTGELAEGDAARFSFLLATPVIGAAGLLKLPDLAGPLGAGIRGQVLLGSALSFAGAYLSVAFLTRYFRTRSLRPFGIYCLIAAAVSLVALAIP
jgi:undecaprenyl-diphosphatase